ncbi:MAG: DndE family protein [Acidobacteria bacterium]|nr:DndE family protein [Acidobacteriota bacterium]
MPDIRPSQTSWEIVDTLKRVWDVRVNYVPIRIAIGRSLLSGDLPSPDAFPADGRSIDTQQILSAGEADYAALYRALIVQRHKRALTDDEFLQLLKAHVDHGFNLIRQDTATFKSTDDWVDYLIELTQTGLEQRKLETPPAPEIVPSFSGLLTLMLGEDAKTGAPVRVEFNRRTNNYLAVAGKPGSGKTQFVKDILAQLRQQSDYKVNFIFFDYSKGDVANDETFVEATRSRVVHLPTESLPFNPFSRVNITSEMSVKMAAQEFSDTVRDVERNLGSIQGQMLYEAIRLAFDNCRVHQPPYPDFYSVRSEVEDAYANNNRKPDTLTEIMRQITEFNIFAPAYLEEQWTTLTDKTVIVDLHELTVLRELTVCLVLDALHRELMAMPDSEVINGARAMRTIIVIDEAHHYLRDKKRNRVLQKLIREIRSKGASVFLLSQSPDDYEQSEFDFAEMLEFIFVLQSSANATKFLQSALGIPAHRARTLVSEVANLKSGEALSKSFEETKQEKVSHVKLRQFWRDFQQ